MDPAVETGGIEFPRLPFMEPSLPEAVINPEAEPEEPPVTPRVILTFARPDYQLLCRQVRVETPPRRVWDCSLREGRWQGQRLTIVAPAVGAPYAAMVLEKLIALGARLILTLGWGGSLQPEVSIGTLVLPATAVSGDGTSRHYSSKEEAPGPDPRLYALLKTELQAAAGSYTTGAVWTTDAFYRETVDLVRYHQARGVLAVDLELAALFAVGRFRRVAVAGLLVISDELATLKWRPGHRSPKFRQAREEAARLVLATAAHWEGGDA